MIKDLTLSAVTCGVVLQMYVSLTVSSLLFCSGLVTTITASKTDFYYATNYQIACVQKSRVGCKYFSPMTLLHGMNKFLQSLDITFRRDPNNFRPRINKLNSVKVINSCERVILETYSCIPYLCVLKFVIKLMLLCYPSFNFV